MRNFIDSLFSPILQMLSWINENISHLGTVVARGYNLNTWLGWVTVLGPGFSLLVQSMIASLVFLSVLYMIRTQSKILIWFKELIGRWV